MTGFSFQEFKPTIFFLLKFIGIYVVANVLYALYITAAEPDADAITREVTRQTSGVLHVFGWDTDYRDRVNKPSTDLLHGDTVVLSVFEGCNGVNTAIIFVAFVVAFGPWKKDLLWFVPLGLLAIHLVNLARITLLFWVAIYRPQAMYFAHKYFFTAILYVVIFLLWVWWVRRNARVKTAVA